MRITERQFRVLRQMVLDHHAAFVANYISPSVISEAVLRRLRKLGLFQSKANAVRDAFVLGVLQAQARAGDPPKTYSQLKARMVAQPVPLSDAERQAVSVAQMKAGQYITALGSKVAGQVGQMVLTPPERLDIFSYQAERQARDQADEDAAERQMYRDTVVDAVANRKAVGALKSDLGHATGDWTRDLERVANTELSGALNAGTAAAAAREHGPDVRVACIYSPACCDACRRAYVDHGQVPKIFRMADLQANGTNAGRRAIDWLPVCPPLHPNCCHGDTEITTAAGPLPISQVRPGDMVLTHKARWRSVRAVWRTPFKGMMVGLDLSNGCRIVITPNHRLRSYGVWLTPGGLKAGNHPVDGLSRQGLTGNDLDAEHAPTQASQGIRFAHVLRVLSTRGVPATAVYLDGQLFIGQGQVNQEHINGKIGLSDDATRLESLENRLFAGTFETTGMGLLPRDQVAASLFSTSNGLMRSPGKVSSLLLSELNPPGLSALAARAQIALDSLEAMIDGGTADPEPTSQHRRTEPFVAVQAHDLRPVERGLDGNLVPPCPEQFANGPIGHPKLLSDAERRLLASDESAFNRVGVDGIVSVGTQATQSQACAQKALDPLDRHACQRRHLAWAHQLVAVQSLNGGLLSFGEPLRGLSVGHAPNVLPTHHTVKAFRPVAHEGLVYNLSVDEDESYVANGVVSKNCGCTMVVVPDGTGFNEAGQLVELSDP